MPKPTPSSPRPDRESASVSAGDADEVFIARQPILDTRQQLVAYELLFRGAPQATAADVVDDVQATSRLLINTFNNFGISQVLGDKLAYVNVSAGLLETDVLELLPPEKVILELLEGVKATRPVLERCQKLCTKGYRFALDDFVYRPELEPLTEIASVIKLDVRALGADGLAREVQRLRGRKAELLAEKVESVEEYELGRMLGISYYQGYYFARPQTLSTKRLDPSVQRTIMLFNMVAGDAEISSVETEFRRDVALSYNLLRFINSAGIGLRHHVDSVRHALVVLGRSRLSRWLSLLLMAGARAGIAPHALFRTALVRAYVMESLGRGRFSPTEQDYLFMTGMFSMLEALLGRPLTETLGELNLPVPVRQALLEQTGPYAPYLRIAVSFERDERDRAAEQAGPLALGLSDLSRAHLEALRRADETAAVA